MDLNCNAWKEERSENGNSNGFNFGSVASLEGSGILEVFCKSEEGVGTNGQLEESIFFSFLQPINESLNQWVGDLVPVVPLQDLLLFDDFLIIENGQDVKHNRVIQSGRLGHQSIGDVQQVHLFGLLKHLSLEQRPPLLEDLLGGLLGVQRVRFDEMLDSLQQGGQCGGTNLVTSNESASSSSSSSSKSSSLELTNDLLLFSTFLALTLTSLPNSWPCEILTSNPMTEPLLNLAPCPTSAPLAMIDHSSVESSSITALSQMYAFLMVMFFPILQSRPITVFSITVPSPMLVPAPMATDLPILQDCAKITLSSFQDILGDGVVSLPTFNTGCVIVSDVSVYGLLQDIRGQNPLHEVSSQVLVIKVLLEDGWHVRRTNVNVTVNQIVSDGEIINAFQQFWVNGNSRLLAVDWRYVLVVQASVVLLIQDENSWLGMGSGAM
ncbi:hypothetical protein WICPIJ_000956 [Wickerhamomyces pijperi]|uniref:Uncharacterized protein n=1 Tax=Wickerhamomyces pijperi TaxID=599730 RepID=A0A9P8QCN1_WICPI|nr:hypothetical protein WICPIJ_000956 [Wickerhamomyces pijperi]